MKPRAFTTKVEFWHRRWLGAQLGLHSSFNGGIDLYDARVGVELKSRYQKYSKSFAIDARQRTKFAQQNANKHLFWAFLVYDLSQSPKSIGARFNIERFVTRRDVWILPWEWIDQFPIATPRTGPYYYVHKTDFPADFRNYTKNDSNIYLPQNCILEDRLIVLAREEELREEA